MLKQRLITAFVLVAILLPVVFAHALWPFAALVSLGIGAAGWEWARLNGAGSFATAFGVAVAAILAFALWQRWGAPLPGGVWVLAALAWLVGGVLALRAGVAGWPRCPRPVRLLLGLALLVVGGLAIVAARRRGINFVLSVFCLVWAADVAAYFGGRAFGRAKLAPTISPGKSRAGVWSGMLGALLLAGLWLWIDSTWNVDSQSIYTTLAVHFGWLGLALGVIGLSAISVVGDLFESLVKRAAGAKDSSALLPGHGGVLDRIDALLPVFPIAMALVSL